MAKFADYTKFAASFCPNLPSMVFNRAMLTASRQYFTQTKAWFEDVTVSVTPDKAAYFLPEPYECALIDTVKSVRLNGELLIALNQEYDNTQTGKPTHFSLSGKEKITLYPTPKEAGTLTITLNLKPSIDTDELPDEVFDAHFEGLLAGSIWQVKRMNETDWSDPQGAMQFHQEFLQFIDDKRIEMQGGNANADTFIQYPPFL